jgi:hypothetical protein
MTREEAINEINKVFTSAYANYIVTALTEGATVSDIQHRWGRAYEAGVKDGLEQKPCKDAVSVASVFEIMGNLMSIPYDFDRSITEKDVSESMDKIRELPRVTPREPRKGHWVKEESIFGWDGYSYQCSECGRSIHLDTEMEDLEDYPYCHCGAKMQEVKE